MLQVKANRRNYWVLRRSFQTLIVNNVQRTAGLQNIVLPDIYYMDIINGNHCELFMTLNKINLALPTPKNK